jgi:hypothetical protein
MIVFCEHNNRSGIFRLDERDCSMKSTRNGYVEEGRA